MIVLTMIVRDEQRIIGRCLKAAMRVAHAALIVDTGSVDETVIEIDSFFENGQPYAVHHRPWVDYATNRNQAMKLAEATYPTATHLFSVDADDIVVCDTPTSLRGRLARKPKTVFQMEIHHEQHLVMHPRLSPTGMGCHFRGVLHEVLVTNGAPSEDLTMCRIDHTAEGHSWDAGPGKWLEHARILAEGLETETEQWLRHRYLFLMGRTLGWAGQLAESEKCYLERITLGGNEQEMYCSLLGLATMQTDRAYDWLLEAANVAPNRREAWVYLAEINIKAGQPRLAWPFVLAAMSAGGATGLSIDWSVQQWRADLALAMAAKAVGKTDVAKAAAHRVAEVARTHKDRLSIEASMRHLADV